MALSFLRIFGGARSAITRALGQAALAPVLFAACISISASSDALAAGDTSGVPASKDFSDEFNGTSVDTARWDELRGAGGVPLNGNPVLIFNTPDAISVSGGVAHIKLARQETKDGFGTVYPFSSGRLQTRRTFLYGRFQIRARLPRGQGIWPGIWLRTALNQPINGEIDLIEGFGSNTSVVQSTMHTWKNGSEKRFYCARLFTEAPGILNKLTQSSCRNVVQANRTDFASGFHIYELDWRPGHVTWRLDGKPYFDVTENVPNVPMMFVFNILLSASWDGGPDKTMALPQFLDVDYIRYTQLKN